MSQRILAAALSSLFAAAIPVGGAMAAADAGKGHDYRTFHADGEIEYGQIGDSYTADLVIYLAGNQFMVMEDLIADFQSKNPDIETVYIETIPPGQILNRQLLKQGGIAGEKTTMNPDVYGSTNFAHLKTMAAEGRMHDYMTYIHNKLALMVAAGNPKGIEGPEDLARDDLVQSHPNPLTEGISKYAGAMMKSLGIHDAVTGGNKCKGCWAVEGKTWFTERHHRETPYRIEHGKADVGIVWATEIVHAEAQGREIDGLAIPAPYNMGDKVGYTIGALQDGRNPYNALRFLGYLATDAAQATYEDHGFVRASAEELKLKPIPTD